MSDTVTFTHTTYHYISSASDTIGILFIPIVSVQYVIAAIIDQYVNNALDIYPNPATNSLTVTVSNPNLEIIEIQVFDISGTEKHVKWRNKRVNLNDLSEGIHFIQVTFQNRQSVVKKIIKK